MIQLKNAQYGEVNFLFTEVETVGGNRNVKLTYPQSDKQSVERQGKVPREFTFQIVIPHEDYYQQRDNLLRVLEDGKKKTLTHPTFGAIENVVNGEYTLTETLSELGRGTIEVSFDVDDAIGIPTQSGNLPSQVQEQSNLLNGRATSDLEDGYEVSTEFPDNVTDAIDNGETVGDSLLSAAQSGSAAIGAAADKVAAYQAKVNTFTNQIGDLVRAPANLSASIAGLYESLNALTDKPGQVLDSMRSLFDFGDDDPDINQNTVGRIERTKNRNLMRANMRTQALSYAYLNASQIEYNTTDDLNNNQDEMEAVYLDLRNNQDLTNEALEQLDRLRVQFAKTISAISLNTRSIITIETNLKPLSILVYEYYGSTELFDTIAELNNIKQNAFVEGELRILTP